MGRLGRQLKFFEKNVRTELRSYDSIYILFGVGDRVPLVEVHRDGHEIVGLTKGEGVGFEIGLLGGQSHGTDRSVGHLENF